MWHGDIYHSLLWQFQSCYCTLSLSVYAIPIHPTDFHEAFIFLLVVTFTCFTIYHLAVLHTLFFYVRVCSWLYTCQLLQHCEQSCSCKTCHFLLRHWCVCSLKVFSIIITSIIKEGWLCGNGAVLSLPCTVYVFSPVPSLHLLYFIRVQFGAIEAILAWHLQPIARSTVHPIASNLYRSLVELFL